MRRAQVVFAKEFGAADREKGENQNGFSFFAPGLTPVGLLIAGRIGPPGGDARPGLKDPG